MKEMAVYKKLRLERRNEHNRGRREKKAQDAANTKN